jgi:GNAT superfamily N-acetyltransferase
MILPRVLSLREATVDDMRAIAALRESVGWGVNEWALRAVIGQPFARCVVVDGPDAVAGVGSGIVYGELGFVGNMIVGPEQRRRGLGSAILETIMTWLETRGCRRLELNATSEGRPLYQRHGFASVGRSATATLGRDLPLVPPDAPMEVRPATPDDTEAIVAYDRPRFGADRGALLGLLLADPGHPFLVAEHDGQMRGYAGLRSDPARLGPFVADDPMVAACLVAEAFARIDAATLRLNLPPGNRPGAAWLRGLGVHVEPWDGRMARGAPLPRREETIYGMTVGALG